MWITLTLHNDGKGQRISDILPSISQAQQNPSRNTGRETLPAPAPRHRPKGAKATQRRQVDKRNKRQQSKKTKRRPAKGYKGIYKLVNMGRCDDKENRNIKKKLVERPATRLDYPPGASDLGHPSCSNQPGMHTKAHALALRHRPPQLRQRFLTT